TSATNGTRPAENPVAEQTELPDGKAMKAAKETKEKNEEELRDAVDKLNKTAVIFDRSLRFQVHDKTHRTMVSVVDIVQDKVIRQIPTEEVLDLVAKMDDYLGLIFDKKA
ncbi:MAG TPA: flagellar protein FlaG, partial [Candidatus Rifleibacterium sp.]|nr:flagellar protein FlaG [Candidatus Rifleibacterium sp.]